MAHRVDHRVAALLALTGMPNITALADNTTVLGGGVGIIVDGTPYTTLALSKGSVVYKTRMFELIHYAPQTPTVWNRPRTDQPGSRPHGVGLALADIQH